jgi:glutaredoxin
MKFIVYGRTVPTCAYCELAKDALDGVSAWAEYVFVDVSVDPRLTEWFKTIDDRHTTYPQVYVQTENGRLDYVGGYTELSGFIEEHRDVMAAEALSAVPEGFTL